MASSLEAVTIYSQYISSDQLVKGNLEKLGMAKEHPGSTASET